MGLAQKRLMREAEPANSGHSGHTPKAQQRPDLLDMNVQSAWDLHHRQVCRLSMESLKGSFLINSSRVRHQGC